jgi:predicted CoA-substrate-specific enzyme activase
MREYGIDIGSVSIKIARFDDGILKKTLYQFHQGRPYNLLYDILRGIGEIDRLALTGGSARLLSEILRVPAVNEVEATARGVVHFHPEARSIIEIGGEDSKLINLRDGRIRDFASNTICAAGTGIFLDQQARRLCYRIEEIGEIALRSKNPARLAGRCSVFAKSDMIHLQQIGTSPEDLIAGLCLALARNFKSVIAKGKQISTPVVFVGGVAANQGMVRSFQEVLGIDQKALIIPEYFNCIGAAGAVLETRGRNDQSGFSGLDELHRWLNRPKIIKRLPPLDGHKKWQTTIYSSVPEQKTRAYLGIDVGSISTNLVLIDEQGNVLARRYLWTKGRPLEVVLDGLRDLPHEVGDKVEVIGVGTTGSGRYLIGEFIGADIIKNEISAQARAAIEINPEVDTIFEIGGQDSKFISIENRTIVDFEMNKVCAAGTGSFLEEQAQALGIDLNDFGDQALEAKAPINLGERCTVFIGSEVVHHQSDTIERENLLAGLGYSIVFNYLNRVVNGKHIGKRIFFQGGVAANKAVISAFEATLGKEITVPTNYDVTGAIGIALLTRDARVGETRFKGFDRVNQPYNSTSFICRHCSNECEINRITVSDQRSIFYGGRCERYETKEKKDTLPDLFRRRNEIFFATDPGSGTRIGIPRGLIFYELFPFFYRFLVGLGFRPILSDPTTRKIIASGSEISSADTCLPVKVYLGHIKDLVEKDIKEFFIPSVITMSPQHRGFDRSFVCPYVQTMPYLARAIFGDSIKVHAPYLYLDRDPKDLEAKLGAWARGLGIDKKRIKHSLAEAIDHQKEVTKKIQGIARPIVENIDKPTFVICSRPYNGYDLCLNLDLPRKIRNLGIQVLPLDLLTLDYKSIKNDFSNMYWHYGQRIMAAADLVSRHDNLFPVYLSNFSCGPDSFLIRFFRERIRGKPSLVIEVDEHSGDAGLVTRCEAFYDSIKGIRYRTEPKEIKVGSELKRHRTIFIPDMCDGAKILASAMRHTGIKAEVLPPPDENSIITGRKFTSGRECLPAIITAGDMVKKINQPDFDPENSAFFMAQGSGPCRFGQYYRLHRLILDELGFSHIPIYAPNQGPSLFDDLGPMGIRFLAQVWSGICAVDGLEARCRMIRPYERDKSSVDRIYDQALIEICNRLEQGQDIVSLLGRIRRQLDEVAVNRSTPKPRIGIVGEIYVRSQNFSNNHLIARLEDLGCETALPSIAEWFFYTNLTRIRNCYSFRQYRRAVFTKIFDRYMRWRQHQIYKTLGLKTELPISDLLDYANQYLHHSFEGEAIVTIGKTIEFMKENFSGVINVLPFTCMPGNIVATIYKRIKDEYPDYPLLNLSLDGLDHALDTMRLEAFANQARTRL